MSQTVDNIKVWPLRTLPKDLGVGAVVLLALLLGLLLRMSVEGATRAYDTQDHSFSIAYPSAWRTADVTDTLLLRAENPEANSTYKTNLTVETRDLDPASPPTLQELVDRRVMQHGTQAGYHFLSSTDRTISGARASEIEYAFVAQPIDTLGSASLPVVVHSREYIIVTKNRTYYVTLAAPQDDYARASEQFDHILQTVGVK